MPIYPSTDHVIKQMQWISRAASETPHFKGIMSIGRKERQN